MKSYILFAVYITEAKKYITGNSTKLHILKTNETAVSVLKRLLPNKIKERRKSVKKIIKIKNIELGLDFLNKNRLAHRE